MRLEANPEAGMVLNDALFPLLCTLMVSDDFMYVCTTHCCLTVLNLEQYKHPTSRMVHV
jgi:hypothetical protein